MAVKKMIDRLHRSGWILLIVGSVASNAAARDLTIGNEHLQATYHPQDKSLKVTAKEQGVTFLNGDWSGRSPKASGKKAVQHPILGQGESIEFAYADGRVDRLTLYQGVPFLCIQPTLANKGKETINLKAVDLVDATLNLPKPVDALRA